MVAFFFPSTSTNTLRIPVVVILSCNLHWWWYSAPILLVLYCVVAPHKMSVWMFMECYYPILMCSLSFAAPRWTGGLPFCCCHSLAQLVHRSVVNLHCASDFRIFSLIVAVELGSGQHGHLKNRKTVVIISVKWDAMIQDMLMYWNDAEKLFLLLATPVKIYMKAKKSVSLL